MDATTLATVTYTDPITAEVAEWHNREHVAYSMPFRCPACHKHGARPTDPEGARWVILTPDAQADYLAGYFTPADVRETEDGVFVLDTHEWQHGRFTGATTCARCHLLPLDYDRFEIECTTGGEL